MSHLPSNHTFPDSQVAQYIAVTMIGGAVSEAAGGDFLEGAVAAAMVHLFNDGAGMSRKECITHGGGCGFKVANNPNASGGAPYYELDSQSDVAKYSLEIKIAASIVGIDPNLIKAIMYMETTHGYYDKLISWGNLNSSILPMNINIDYWQTGFGTRDTLSNPYNNILAGATMIKLIQNNMIGPYGVAQIATLYNNINATQVSNYGARVEAIYNAKPW